MIPLPFLYKHTPSRGKPKIPPIAQARNEPCANVVLVESFHRKGCLWLAREH